MLVLDCVNSFTQEMLIEKLSRKLTYLYVQRQDLHY